MFINTRDYIYGEIDILPPVEDVSSVYIYYNRFRRELFICKGSSLQLLEHNLHRVIHKRENSLQSVQR